MYYKLGRLLLYTYLRLRNRLRFFGLENVPEGPVILACNHASYMDPVLVSIAFHRPGRRVRWMAWKVLFRVPVLGFLIRRLGAFPVMPDRADRGALETAQDIAGGTHTDISVSSAGVFAAGGGVDIFFHLNFAVSLDLRYTGIAVPVKWRVDGVPRAGTHWFYPSNQQLVLSFHLFF